MSITLQTNSGNIVCTQNNKNNNRIIRIQDSNCFRKLRNCFEKVKDVFNSFKSVIMTRCGVTCYTGNKDLTLLSQVDSVYGDLIADKLKYQTQLDPHSFSRYLGHISDNNFDSQIVQTYFTHGSNSNLPPKKENANNLMIPIVLDGLERHIVAVFISFEEGKPKIEFYDPKGLTIADRESDRLAFLNHLTLPQAIASIVSTYCNNGQPVTVVENTRKDQNDTHNCGIHVLNYFEQRLKGFEPHEISSDFHTFDRSSEVRTRIIDNLIEDHMKNQRCTRGIDFEHQDINESIQRFGIASLLKYKGSEWIKSKIRKKDKPWVMKTTGEQCLIKEKGEEWLAKHKMSLVKEHGEKCLIKEKGEAWLAKNKAGLIRDQGEAWFEKNKNALLTGSGRIWLESQPNKDGLIKRRGIVWFEQYKSHLIQEVGKQWSAEAELICQKGKEWLDNNGIICSGLE